MVVYQRYAGPLVKPPGNRSEASMPSAGKNIKKDAGHPRTVRLTKSDGGIRESIGKQKKNVSALDPVEAALGDPYFYRDAPVSIWVEDFSEVKSRCEKLKKQGIRNLRTYLERHPEEVVSLAGKVKIVDVNNATLRLYRARDKKDFLKGLKQIFSKTSYETFKDGLLALAEGRREFMSEAVNLTMSKEGLNILLQWFVPAEYTNSWSRIIVFVSDITALRTEQTEILYSEEKYRNLFESIDEAIFLIDVETGVILAANKKAGELIGLPTGNIVGMHFSQFHPAEQADFHKAMFQKHVQRDVTVSDNVDVCDASGERKLVSIISSLLSIGGKKYISAIFRQELQKELAAGTLSNAAAHAGRLSPREREIVCSIAAGLNNHQIAKKHAISEATVKTHRTRIMKKLQLHKTAELVMYAVKARLLGEK
jgi:PAS domain S-box-containing protein